MGALTKTEVRERARALGLPNAERAESQDACLVVEGAGFGEALRRRFEAQARPGEVVDPEGRILGSHDGIHRYTVGQRKGLGIALGSKAWVEFIDGESGRIVLTTDHDRLLVPAMTVKDLCWAPWAEAKPLRKAQVKIRYLHDAVPCSLTHCGSDEVLVSFETPQRAVTPGQAAVFYDGDRMAGGGWIEGAGKGK